MKKYILSILVIFTFGTYVLYKQFTNTNDISFINNLNSNSSNNNQNITVNNPSSNIISKTPAKIIKNVISKIIGDDSSDDDSYQATIKTTNAVVSPKTVISKQTAAPAIVANTGKYKDGQYTGVSADAYYGNIQVQVTVSVGKIADVQFLDYPQGRGTSISINNYAMPILKQEAIQAQSANVNAVSGATHSSGAFKQSLQSALSQAVNS